MDTNEVENSDTLIAVPVPKGKGTITVDIAKLPSDVYREVVLQGLKVLLGRSMSKITKANLPDDEVRFNEARVQAEKNLEAMYEGKVKITGAPKAEKVSGKVMTEATRLAREKVKQAIRDSGGKISHYKASEITAAAKEMIKADPSFIEQAKQLLEMREKGETKIDIMALIKADPNLVAKDEAEKAEKAKQLSAKQASIPAKRKPRPEAHA